MDEETVEEIAARDRERERDAYVQRAEFAENRLKYFERLSADQAKQIVSLTERVAELEAPKPEPEPVVEPAPGKDLVL